MSVVDFTDEQRALLSEMFRKARGQRAKGGALPDSEDPGQAPEVYIAHLPDGVPAREGTELGVAAGSIQSTSGGILRDIGLQKEIHNTKETTIEAGYHLVVRDKFGTWFLQPSQSVKLVIGPRSVLKISKAGESLRIYDDNSNVVDVFVWDERVWTSPGLNVLDEATSVYLGTLSALPVGHTGTPNRIWVDDNAVYYASTDSAGVGMVVKYDRATKTVAWSKTGTQSPKPVAVDAAGNVYTGYNGGGAKVYNTAGTLTLTIADTWLANDIAVDLSGNIYVAHDRVSTKSVHKYNSSGVSQWFYDFGFAGSCTAIDVDPATGNVLVISGGVGRLLDSTGAQQWTFTHGFALLDVAFDDEGNAYFCGGGSATVESVTDGVVTDIEVRKFSPTGTPIWRMSVAAGNANVTSMRFYNDCMYLGFTRLTAPTIPATFTP